MNKTPANASQPAGSSQEWDTIWKQVGTEGNDRAKVFTRTRPRTIFEFWQRCYFEDLLLLMQPKSDWHFLELASGRGTTSLYLASQGFRHLTLLDLSETALQQAQRNFASEQVPIPQTVVGDAQATGLPSASFDLIYNIGVLEHFDDPSQILAESWRLLKPGGRIFMPIVPTMPYSHSILCRLLLNPLSLVKRLVKTLLGRTAVAKHSDMVRTTTGAAEYEHIARQVGFQGVQCQPYNPYWKLYSDGSRFEEAVVIPLYRAHYALKKRLGFRPGLRTFSGTSLCLLLTATKPV